MDKRRPQRPTSLDLFPRRRAGSQDSINNNSLGKKESWKASPATTGDAIAPAKAEDKVRHAARRPAPKPPAAHGANGRSAAHASDARVRPREKQQQQQQQQPAAAANPPSSATPRTQRRAGVGGAFPARGGARGGAAMREKDGATAGREDRRGGRLCEEAKARDRDRDKTGHPRARDGARSRGAKAGAKGANRGGAGRAGHMACSQQVYLTAMVVPRTPVAPRTQDANQNQGQNHDRPPDRGPALSRSSSEGGSNRMSLGSDTEGPPPAPPQPSVPHPSNPDITEEEGEGAATPQPAALRYDPAQNALLVEEERACFHGDNNNERHDDSDAETVYQSANEEEDPEYREERRRKEERKGEESGSRDGALRNAAANAALRPAEDRRREAERRGRQEEEEEEVKRRREEEVKRRREVVARICRQPKATWEEDESSGGRAYRSRKFLNLFAKGSSRYSAAGAGSFGLFSCLLDGAERQQSHRAVYRFVPRHEDELQLEVDDPVLVLDRSEDLWCRGYNMRSGCSGIFPAFYLVEVAGEPRPGQQDGWTEQFPLRFLGSVQVPVHKGNGVLCAAMQKVVGTRQPPGQPPSACVLEVSVRGVKISVQDQCRSAHRGDQCFHFFHLKNISFCGCHPKHSRYFGFITKHPEQQRFACHVMVSETTLHPLAECVRRAFQQYYREHVGVFCPTEDIFIE